MDVCLKKRNFSLAKGSNRNDDRKLRARQKRANEFSSVSLAREILNATTDLKLSSETLTDYPTHAVLQGCRSVQEQDRRQGVFFFYRASLVIRSLFWSLFFFVEGGWCRGGERRGESRSTFALRMRKSSSIFSPPPPPTVVVESIGSVYYVIILFRCIVRNTQLLTYIFVSSLLTGVCQQHYRSQGQNLQGCHQWLWSYRP